MSYGERKPAGPPYQRCTQNESVCKVHKQGAFYCARFFHSEMDLHIAEVDRVKSLSTFKSAEVAFRDRRDLRLEVDELRTELEEYRQVARTMGIEGTCTPAESLRQHFLSMDKHHTEHHEREKVLECQVDVLNRAVIALRHCYEWDRAEYQSSPARVKCAEMALAELDKHNTSNGGK